MKAFFATIVLAAIAPALAANITEVVTGILPSQCSDQCNQWVSTVGDCITNLNANFSASVNTGDVSSWNFEGDLSAIPPCFCSAEAVQASESCLSCASENLCVTPALTMQDYSMVCQDPKNAWSIFRRYHPNINPDSCSSETESPTESPSATESPTESPSATESPTETTESPTDTESSTETESPTETTESPSESPSATESPVTVTESIECTTTVTASETSSATAMTRRRRFL